MAIVRDGMPPFALYQPASIEDALALYEKAAALPHQEISRAVMSMTLVPVGPVMMRSPVR